MLAFATDPAMWVIAAVVLTLWFGPLRLAKLVLIGVLVAFLGVAITNGPSLQLIGVAAAIAIAAAFRAAPILGSILREAFPEPTPDQPEPDEMGMDAGMELAGVNPNLPPPPDPNVNPFQGQEPGQGHAMYPDDPDVELDLDPGPLQDLRNWRQR